MATYSELVTASNNSALITRIAVACAVAAEKIRSEPTSTPNHVNRLKWAKTAFYDPTDAARGLIWCVLAQNRAAPLIQITGADDATVQTAVDSAVDAVATGD